MQCVDGCMPTLHFTFTLHGPDIYMYVTFALITFTLQSTLQSTLHLITLHLHQITSHYMTHTHTYMDGCMRSRMHEYMHA